MRRLLLTIPLLALSAATTFAQAPAAKGGAMPAAAKQGAASAKAPLVEFEMMTWPEVKAALAAGKTTAIVYTGGTEQRGPQNVNGGHTLMARATARAIALKLGNAIVMPTLAYSPNRASADLPGTIGLSNEVFGQMLTEISEQAIITGFKNVMIMGDHGGGQPAVFAEVAKKLDAKYSPEGKHVYFVDEVYAKAQGDFDEWLVAHGYPRQLARRHSRHFDDALSGRRQRLGPQGTDPDRGRRSGSAPRRARSGTRHSRSERAAAQEQRHLGRRPPLDRGAGQAGVRHQGELRGEADQRLPRQSAQGGDAAVILQLQDCRTVGIAGREGRQVPSPSLPAILQFRLPAVSHLLILGGSPDDRLRAARANIPASHTPLALDARTLPFLRAEDVSIPGAPRVILIDDVHLAFPDAQTGGTRLVLTQSTYLLQKWVDRLDEGDRIVATADRAALEQCAPEAFQGRGAWQSFSLVNTEDTRDTKEKETLCPLCPLC